MKRYKVKGTIKFAAEVIIDAESEDAAFLKALDRFEDGSLDGFTLGRPIDDSEIYDVEEINKGE